MRTGIRPSGIRIAPSGICTMGCPVCPVTTGESRETIGEGLLDPGDLAALLDANPHIATLELCGFGEILRSPALGDLLECAFRRGRPVTVDSGTNLNTEDLDLLESLVTYRVRRLTCSIDGATQEVYRRYRRHGDLDLVLQGIRALNAFKASQRTPYPVLTWQFIVFGHNEHEIPLARGMARELGMRFRLKVSREASYSPVRDWEFVYRQHRLSATHAARRKHDEPQREMRTFCHQLWEEPQVNWDGRMLGCCHNYWGDFGGNVFRDGLSAVLNSEAMCGARKMLQGGGNRVPGVPCTECSVYHHMLHEDDWLSRGLGRRAFVAARATYQHVGAQGALQSLQALGHRQRVAAGRPR